MPLPTAPKVCAIEILPLGSLHVLLDLPGSQVSSDWKMCSNNNSTHIMLITIVMSLCHSCVQGSSSCNARCRPDSAKMDAMKILGRCETFLQGSQLAYAWGLSG